MKLEAQTLLIKSILKNDKEGQKESVLEQFRPNGLTLAGILEALDGVMEMEGRMLIMTTNYPERLDEALIRPGRIDMKIKFGRCTTKCLIQMYEHFFADMSEREIWPEDFDRSQLPNDRWTPAEAAQVLLTNSENPRSALNDFIDKMPNSSFKLETNNNTTSDELEEVSS